MPLSNSLVYNGEMLCANDKVAAQVLSCDISLIAKPKAGAKCGHHWMTQIISPDRPVVFANTDTIFDSSKYLESNSHALENLRSHRTVNETEAHLTAQIINALLHSGVA